MKKWIVVILAALVFLYGDVAPFDSVDAADLCVVETLFISEDRGQILLESGEAEGRGATIPEALEDMRNNAPGRLFLKQTKRLLFCREAEQLASPLDLPWEIPVGAAVYRTEVSSKTLLKDLEGVEKRLDAQEKNGTQVPTLAQVKNQLLRQQEG